MPQKTNLNISPYYDDFDKYNNFYKVLFKPGHPVQARELTTLQSILQNQVESFGSHIFKEGSMVIPGNISYDSFYSYVKLNSDHLGVDISVYGKELVGKRLRGQDSEVVVVVDKYFDIDTTIGITDPTLFVKYVRSGTDNETNPLRDGEVLVTENSFTYGNTAVSAEDSIGTLISENATGAGSAAAIGAGVYFIRGTFVDVAADKIILDPYTNEPSYRVGLTISEEIITAKENTSLYDNAKGFSNYAAPGADRLKISTTLSTKLLTDNDDKTFVELLRVENGEVKKLQNKSQYSLIRDYFAKRTFEESGDYTVGNYDVDVKESLNDRQSNGGVYFENQETRQGNTPSEDLMGVSISAGKAYVRGYDIESKSNKVVDVEKPRDKEKIDNAGVPFEMGTLFRLNNVVGTPIIDNNISANTVDLYDGRRTSSQNATGGSNIGKARVYAFNLTDGTYENKSSKWDLYLYDIQTFTSITINQSSTFAATERIRGASSNAIGYINAGGTGTNFSLIGTSGTFIAGEKLIINENPDVTRVLNSFIAYSTDDIKSVIQNSPSKNSKYKTHFIGDTVLGPKVLTGFSISDTLSVSTAGLSTCTGRNWASKVKVGDIIQYQPLGASLPTVNKVNSIAADGTTITLVATESVANVANGPVVFSDNVPFKVMRPIVRKKGGLYGKLSNANVASVDLATSELYASQQLLEQSTNGSGVLTIQTSGLSNASSALFQPFDAERYSIHYADDTTEALTSDQVVVANDGLSVTFSGLSKTSQSNNVTVNTTFRKQGIVSKAKEYVRSEKVTIDKCVSAATTALSGLTQADWYGMRVEDQEISLNLPDVVQVIGVYESLDTNVPTLDTLDFPAGLSLDTASILGEHILGSDTGALAQITNRVSATRVEIAYLNSLNFNLGELVSFKESAISSTIQTINKGNHQLVTNHFTLDKGHKDTYLDYSRLVRKNDGYKPTNHLLAVFNYYTINANDTGDVYTVNSYPDERFSKDVPHLPDGTRASDTLDFRARVSRFTSTTTSPFAWASRDVGAVAGNPGLVITPNESSTLGYEFYLPRIDRLVLDVNGNFNVIKGSSSVNPTFPVNEEQAMDVARIELPAYLYDVDDARIIMVDNKRYTMRDIGKLEDRIENLEIVTSLSLLELSTKTLQVKDADGLDRFKSGFFVDDYKDDKRLDISLSKMSINTTNNELTCPIDFDFIGPDLALNPSIDTTTADYSQDLELLDSNVQKTGELVTLKYSEKEFLSQPLASRVENVNPFNMISWTGRITLSPQSDNWVRNVYVDGGERTVTGDRNDEFIETIKIGSAPDKYIRSRNVRFTCAGLQPYTRYYPFFDSASGIDFIPKLVEISMSSGSFTVGETVKGYVGGNHLFTARINRPNHKSGNFNSGAPKTYGKNPYDRSITLSTAYSASSTVLNIDIASLAKEAQGRYNGYIVKDMVILGETSGAQASVSNVRLINDNWGDLEGSFFFRDPNTNPAPPLRWTTGQKTFKLTSSSTNSKSLPGSLLISRGETSYWTSGIVDTYRQTRVIVRMPPPPPPRQRGDGDNADPLAQSFTTEREGMFLTSVDLFFGNKDENEKVTVELRTVELGTPTGELVQDFARVVLDPVEINTSTDGKAATNVKFPSPVYLTPQTEYAIVILAPTTNNYEAWIARMGEKTVGTSNLPDDENVIVTKQYIGGSLFKSQNGTIWTPNQFEDLKFKIYRADFVNSGTLTLYNPSIETGDVGHLGLVGDAVKTLPRKLKVGIDNVGGVPGTSGVAAPLVTGAKVTDTSNASDVGSSIGYIEAVGGTCNGTAISAAGSGFKASQTYTGVELYPITSQERTRAEATVVINGSGAVSNISAISNNGAGYKVGDVVGITTADVGGQGSGAQITVTTVTNWNTLFLTNVQGKQFDFAGGNVDIYVNNTQFNSGNAHFSSSSRNGGDEYDGNTLEITQFSHGMHGASNIVELSGIEPNSIPTTITADVDVNSTGTISVANTSIFGKFENKFVSSGYAKINNEIIYYDAITAGGGGAGTIGIGTRGIDASTSRKHLNGTQIQPYTLNGVNLRRINKKHSSTSILDNPKDLDKYYLAFDRTSEDTKRDGDDLLNFNNENSLGGQNLFSTKNIQFNTVHPRINVITPGDGTTITGKIRTVSGTSAGGNESSFIDKGYESVEINDTTRLSSPRIIASKVNEEDKLTAMPMNKSFTMSLDLTSTSSHVSPVVDLDNAIVILGRNRLNKPVDDYASNGASNSVSEDPHTGIYVTKRVNLKNPSTSLKVLVGASRHLSADFRVLYQLFKNDSEDIEQAFVPFPGYDNLRDTDGDGFGDSIIDTTKNNGRPDAKVVPNVENEFSEYQFSNDDLEPFTGFRIKIVMSGTNEAYAPKFKDFRVIALA